MSEQQTISVKILDREFKIKCPPDKIAELEESAQYLDKKMREVRDAKVLSVDRIAIIASLNITHELLTTQHQKNTYVESMSKGIESLHTKIEDALAREA